MFLEDKKLFNLAGFRVKTTDGISPASVRRNSREANKDILIDLSEADLSRANLTGADLRQVNIREASLISRIGRMNPRSSEHSIS
jgi:uncharacterized protein YjbI with pentapeptide repeats